MARKSYIIGMDAKRIVRNGTGLGTYGRNLINSVSVADTQNLYNLYVPDNGKEELKSQVIERDNVHFCYPDKVCGAVGKAYWRSSSIVKQLRKEGVHLFHGLSGELPFGIKKAGIPAVLTIHDLIFMRHPEYYHWWDAKIYRLKFHFAVREAERIIAISERTKQDILEFSDFPAEKIDVIYQSCDSKLSEVREYILDYLPKQFILNVGTIEKRKNALLALKALQYISEDVHLVIVGRKTKYTEEIIKFAEDNKLTSRLHILHGINNKDLSEIYNRASLFVYPSRYEGFGIPIIEAIESGLAVVACEGSCLEEAGGPYSLYTSPDDEKGFARCIDQLLSNDEDRLDRIEKSKKWVKRFKGIDVAREVLEVYNKVL